jgi:hypothetical protein
MPSLAGETWSIHYSPIFQTVDRTSVSGRERRVARYVSPMWEITLSFDRLRSDSLQELQTLMGFFSSLQMMTSSFLIVPPGALGVYSSAVLGTGDGSTTSFIVTRQIGSYMDTVQAAASISGVYVSGSPVSYTSSILPLMVTLSSPPAPGAPITISYTAAHLVRLEDSSLDFEEIVSNIWQLGSLKLRSVRQ